MSPKDATPLKWEVREHPKADLMIAREGTLNAMHWVVLVVGLAAVTAYGLVNHFSYITVELGGGDRIVLRLDNWTGHSCTSIRVHIGDEPSKGSNAPFCNTE